MATAGIEIRADFPDIGKLRESLRNLYGPRDMSAILGDVLEKAIWPAYLRLREVTPDGPTGNLKRAINYKVKTYPRDGGAVALIGFNRSGVADASSAQGGSVLAGKDRAFHQWWIEFGTKKRVVTKVSNKPYQRRSKLGNVHWVSGQNSIIASSFNRLGPFRMIKDTNGGFRTDPAYPKAFFRKAKKGEAQLVIPETPEGGVDGQPPVRTAWEQSKGKVAFILQQELRISLEKAISALVVRTEGSLSNNF